MLVLSLFVFSLFAAQLLRLQGFDAATVSEAAARSRTQTEVIPAMRGSILDTHGEVLAQSIERRTVTVDQQAVSQYAKVVDGTSVKVGVAGATADLAPLLGISAATLGPQLTGSARYRIIAKDVTPLTWRKVQALGVPGVLSERTTERVYPTSTTAASLVGFVLDDGRPGNGIEWLGDASLRGKAGTTAYETGQDGRVIPNGRQVTKNAVAGSDVTLTIDADLQWYAQNALAQKVNETNAISGTVVVQNVRTGELLAVASYPTYDPNNAGQARGILQNLAFNDVYEPGSTGKVITAAAALQEGVVTPSTPVVVPNRLPRSDQSFRDSHDHATEYLTFTGVLAQSSNIGTVLAGEQVPPATMESYMRKFGLGAKTGTSFPGESPGLLAASKDWSGSQRYTVLYGQGLSVTAIQAAGVYQTIANDGLRLPPRIVKATTNGSGTSTPGAQGKPVRVVSAEVAAQLRDMLEGVVGTEGTAPEARIPGYRVAGKTGTADRYDDRLHKYSGKTASFIGFAPADDPELVVAVTLQRPIKGYFGGIVAAPVFRDVMSYALREMAIPPTGTKAPKVTIKSTPELAASDPDTLRDRGKNSSAR